MAGWTKAHPWLTYSLEDSTMHCTYCVALSQKRGQVIDKAAKNSKFITGSTNFKTTTLDDHEKTAFHKRAAEVYKADAIAKSQPIDVANSDAGRALKALKELESKAVSYRIRNAHAVIKANRPFSDYKWLCDLDEAKGLDLGDTAYGNDKACAVFVECMADYERKKILDHVESAKFFSIAMDGSTDKSGSEQESMYLRTCNNGQINTYFLTIGTPKSTSSEDLHTFVKAKFKTTGLEKHKEKFVGIGSDGANNMIGVKTGLTTRLKKDFKEMVSVHCHAHRLELAFKDAIKGLKVYDRVITLLLGLYYMYHRNGKSKNGLIAAMEVCDIKNAQFPKRIGGTRWLPHLKRAIVAFVKSYRAFVYHLGTVSHQNAKAGGLGRMATDFQTIACILLLQVIYSCIQLSLSLLTLQTIMQIYVRKLHA